MNKKHNLFFAVLLICVLIAVGVYVYKYVPLPGSHGTSGNGVSDIDITKGSADSLQGLPNDLPVNKGSIVEQKRLDYPAQGTILYSLSYRTSRTPEDIIGEYKTYFADRGYILNSASSTAASTVMNIAAQRPKDSISVVVTPDAGFNLVTLAILHSTR